MRIHQWKLTVAVTAVTCVAQAMSPVYAGCHAGDFQVDRLKLIARSVNQDIGDLNISVKSADEPEKKRQRLAVAAIVEDLRVQTLMFRGYLNIYHRLRNSSDRHAADETIEQEAQGFAARIAGAMVQLETIARGPARSDPVEKAVATIGKLQKQFACAGSIAIAD